MRALSAMERAAAYGGRGAYWAGPAEEVEHLMPRSRGRLHTADNLAPAGDCNQRKRRQGSRGVSKPISDDGQRLDLSADVDKQRGARVIAGMHEAGSTHRPWVESWT